MAQDFLGSFADATMGPIVFPILAVKKIAAVGLGQPSFCLVQRRAISSPFILPADGFDLFDPVSMVHSLVGSFSRPGVSLSNVGADTIHATKDDIEALTLVRAATGEDAGL